MDDTNETLEGPSKQEFEELVKQANAGNEDAIVKLREYLDKWPEIWRPLGDLAKHVQQALVSQIAGKGPLLVESITRKLDVLRAELLTAGASPLEKLAVERVLACWLQVQCIDVNFPIAGDFTASLPSAKFVVQLRESSQRRFDAATKSLATLRRLAAETPDARKAAPLRVHAESA